MRIVRAKQENVQDIVDLIQLRINWLDDHHYNGWNTNRYFEAYPYAYFEENIESFYLIIEDNKTVAAACYYFKDELWKDQKEAVYIHHLVSHPDYKGMGEKLVIYAEEIAKEKGYDRVRLDCDHTVEVILKYYDQLGYTRGDTFVSGPYKGILREKIIRG